MKDKVNYFVAALSLLFLGASCEKKAASGPVMSDTTHTSAAPTATAFPVSSPENTQVTSTLWSQGEGATTGGHTMGSTMPTEPSPSPYDPAGRPGLHETPPP